MSNEAMQEILKLTPEQASEAVHERLFGNKRQGKRWVDSLGRLVPPPRWHISEPAMLELIDRFRLTMGKPPPGEPYANQEKPWFAGRLGVVLVRSETPGCALCKAALIMGERVAIGEATEPAATTSPDGQ